MLAADVVDLMDLNFGTGSDRHNSLAVDWQRIYRPMLDERSLVALLPPADPAEVFEIGDRAQSDWLACFGIDLDTAPYWVDPQIAAGEIPQVRDGVQWLAEVMRYAVAAHILNQAVAAEERYADTLRAGEAQKYRKTLTTRPLAEAAQAGLDLLGDGWQELLPTNQKPNSRKALSRW